MLVTPKNPNTALQSSQRAKFAAAAKAWKGLANAAQLTWKTFAASLKNNLSSFNAYVRVSITSQIVGTTPPTNAPYGVVVPPTSLSGTPPFTTGPASGGAQPRHSASSSWKWYYPIFATRLPRFPA